MKKLLYLIPILFLTLNLRAQNIINSNGEQQSFSSVKGVTADTLLRGGIQVGYADTNARNAIPLGRRRIGMEVKVLNTAASDGVKSTWELVSLSSNNGANWKDISRRTTSILNTTSIQSGANFNIEGDGIVNGNFSVPTGTTTTSGLNVTGPSGIGTSFLAATGGITIKNMDVSSSLGFRFQNSIVQDLTLMGSSYALGIGSETSDFFESVLGNKQLGWRTNGVTRGYFDGSGNLFLTTAPATATGTNNSLVIDASTGQIKQQAITGSGTWGSITGTLSSQTDLQNALNLKLNIANPSSTGLLTNTSSSAVAIRGIISRQTTSDNLGAKFDIQKDRVGGVITTGDVLGNLQFSGYDGANYITGAKILATSTGTISTGVVSAKMDLQTANSSGTLTTAIDINASQVIQIPHYNSNNGVLYTDGSGNVSQVAGTTDGTFLGVHDGGVMSFVVPFTLTTTGTSGAATFTSGILNIPQYSGGSGATYFKEIPSGSINSSNTSFSITHTPASNTFSVFRNGVMQVPSVDYTISGTTITYLYAPSTGDTLYTIYAY